MAVELTSIVPTLKLVPDAGSDVVVTSGHIPSALGAKFTRGASVGWLPVQRGH